MRPRKEFTREQILLAIKNNTTLVGISKELGVSDAHVPAVLKRFGFNKDLVYHKQGFKCEKLTPEQQEHTDWMFRLREEVEVSKMTFEPIMEDFFGEKGKRVYKRFQIPPDTELTVGDYFKYHKR